MTRWALVPAVPTAEMIASGDAAGDWGYNESSEVPRHGRGYDGAFSVFGSMLCDSPGNALLSEILAARDAINSTDNHRIQTYQTKRLLEALAKLGPTL